MSTSSPETNPQTQNAPSSSSVTAGAMSSPLSLLSDLEARIAGLKQMHEQTAARETELSARELELAQRETTTQRAREELSGKEQELKALGLELKAQSEAIRQQQESIAQALAELTRQKDEASQLRAEADRKADGERRALSDLLEQRERAIGEHERAAQAWKKEQEARAQELAKREEAIAQRDRELVTRQQELDRRDAETKQIAERAAQQDRSLKELCERVELSEADLDKREAAAREKESKVGEREKWLLELEGSVARRQKEAEQSSAAVESLESEIREREERLAARERDVHDREKASAELSVKQQVQTARQAQLDAQEAALRTEAARIERERAEIVERERALATMQEREETSAIYAGRAEELQLKLGEASSARAGLERDLAEARAELALAREQLGTMSQRPSVDTLSAEQQQRKALEERVERMEAEAKARGARIAELEGRLEKSAEYAARAREAERLQEETDRLKRELGARDEAIVQREAQCEELRATTEEMRTKLAQAEASAAAAATAAASAAPNTEHIAEIEKRDQAIAKLKQKFTELKSAYERVGEDLDRERARGAELQQRVAAGNGGGEGSERPVSDVQARRARLRAYKKLLQTQARKIVAAQAALQKRHADCEQILSHRVKIAAVAENVARREKKLASSKARGGALATMAYSVATLGLLAGLSWEVSRRVWPGTYVSRAVVEVDSHDRSVSPEKVVAWQKDTQEMLQDPRLMEVIAERMKRRGFESLSSAAEVRSLITGSLYTQSSQAGRLEVELRAEGEQRSQMLLDTIVTALKSVADESKGERAHDLGLKISAPAVAAGSPLMDERLQQAGMVFGGSVLGTGLLGMFAYARLAAGKRSFDAKAAADVAMADVDWAALEASVKRNSPSEQANASSGKRAA